MVTHTRQGKSSAHTPGHAQPSSGTRSAHGAAHARPGPAQAGHVQQGSGQSTAQAKAEAVEQAKAKSSKKVDAKAGKVNAAKAKKDAKATDVEAKRVGKADAKALKAGAPAASRPDALCPGRIVRYVMPGPPTVHPAIVAAVGGFLPDPQGRSHSQVWLEAHRDKTLKDYEARDTSAEYSTCALVVFLAVSGTGGTQSRLMVPYAKPQSNTFAPNTWHWPDDSK